jgi:hypothetical protein
MNFLRVLGFGESPQPVSAVDSARQRLREAIAACGPAERVLMETSAAVQRVETLVDAAEEAADEAASAEAAVADATRRWAEAGAGTDVASVDQALLDKMERARRASNEAHFKAQGAKAGLPAIRAAEDQARAALSDARLRKRTAIVDVMLAIAEPALLELEEQARKCVPAVARIQALRIIMHGKWGSAHSWHHFSNPAAGPRIERRLQAAGFRVPTEEALRELSYEWARFGERLAADPDATF